MPLDLEALETSFDLVAPQGDALMETFYARLFSAAPAVKPLFRRDRSPAAEGDAFERARAAAQVAARPRRDRSQAPRTRRRHVTYGAQPAHYPVVGEVLIASMAEVAGAAWRPSYERAWTAAFDVVAGAMLDGAAAELRLAA